MCFKTKEENKVTDTEMKRREAICHAAHVKDIGDVSDNDPYYQRMILFAALVKQNKGKAWKSWRHENGELCLGGGWFIVGIDTPEGSYTYHYAGKYFDLFDCIELPKGKPVGRSYGKRRHKAFKLDVLKIYFKSAMSCAK